LAPYRGACNRVNRDWQQVWFAYVDLASAYGWKGRQADAQAAVVELLKLKPNYTVQKLFSDRFSDDPIYLSVSGDN
jgi:adenylate cyclase